MSGVNKVILVGHLGANPEVRYTAGGQPVANFRLATTERWVKNGEKSELTEWHRVVAWGKLAEICGQYLSKGRQVFIEGRLQTRQWEDREGNKKYTTEIIASGMQMLGSKRDGSGAGKEGNNYADPGDLAGGTIDDDVPF